MAAVAGAIGGKSIPETTGLKVSGTKKEQCLQAAHFYQQKFPRVPTLSSEDLLEHFQDYYIVDARTRAERKISMIPGAIPLKKFEQQYRKNALDDNKSVVVHCTIGYRSGMEATRLRHCYPELLGKIRNLDGIVAYTLVANEKGSPNKKNGDRIESTKLQGLRPTILIEPLTGQPTNRVHTFGPMWDFTDDSCDGIHFSTPTLIARILLLGGLTFVRTIQRAVHFSRHCCKDF